MRRDGIPELWRLYPGSKHLLDTHAFYEGLELPASSSSDREKPYVFINMVASLDGKVSVSGRSGAIGSDVDRQTMRQLRSLSDAVMVGSGTVRAEGVSLTSEGRSSHEPFALIVSSSLDIPLEENLRDNERERTLILTTEVSVEEAGDRYVSELEERSTIVLCNPSEEGGIDMGSTMKTLKSDYGIERVLVEGGPGLNHHLVSLGLVDEIFLTLSPKILSGSSREALNIVNGELLEEAPEITLISVQKAGSELFLRYSF